LQAKRPSNSEIYKFQQQQQQQRNLGEQQQAITMFSIKSDALKSNRDMFEKID
jgi:hypothetical protein